VITMITIKKESGRLSIELTAIPMGNDWCIL
jgi:hypothetical protein